ncbi:hypothetical protein JOM56_011015 [Amanita muscaria]
MATQFHLPGRHSPSAPRFDPRRPTELPVYFEELDYLFSLAAIHNDQEKKKLSHRYLAIDDSEYWETIPQYSADYSFDLFKQEIFKFPSLQQRVHQRLQMKLPDHFPDDPYLLDDIQSAAKSVLQSAIVCAPATSESVIFPTPPTYTVSDSQDITPDMLNSIAQVFTTVLEAALSTSAPCTASPSTGSPIFQPPLFQSAPTNRRTSSQSPATPATPIPLEQPSAPPSIPSSDSLISDIDDELAQLEQELMELQSRRASLEPEISALYTPESSDVRVFHIASLSRPTLSPAPSNRPTSSLSPQFPSDRSTVVSRPSWTSQNTPDLPTKLDFVPEPSYPVAAPFSSIPASTLMFSVSQTSTTSVPSPIPSLTSYTSRHEATKPYPKRFPSYAISAQPLLQSIASSQDFQSQPTSPASFPVIPSPLTPSHPISATLLPVSSDLTPIDSPSAVSKKRPPFLGSNASTGFSTMLSTLPLRFRRRFEPISSALSMISDLDTDPFDNLDSAALTDLFDDPQPSDSSPTVPLVTPTLLLRSQSLPASSQAPVTLVAPYPASSQDLKESPSSPTSTTQPQSLGIVLVPSDSPTTSSVAVLVPQSSFSHFTPVVPSDFITAASLDSQSSPESLTSFLIISKPLAPSPPLPALSLQVTSDLAASCATGVVSENRPLSPSPTASLAFPDTYSTISPSPQSAPMPPTPALLLFFPPDPGKAAIDLDSAISASLPTRPLSVASFGLLDASLVSSPLPVVPPVAISAATPLSLTSPPTRSNLSLRSRDQYSDIMRHTTALHMPIKHLIQALLQSLQSLLPQQAFPSTVHIIPRLLPSPSSPQVSLHSLASVSVAPTALVPNWDQIYHLQRLWHPLSDQSAISSIAGRSASKIRRTATRSDSERLHCLDIATSRPEIKSVHIPPYLASPSTLSFDRNRSSPIRPSEWSLLWNSIAPTAVLLGLLILASKATRLTAFIGIIAAQVLESLGSILSHRHRFDTRSRPKRYILGSMRLNLQLLRPSIRKISHIQSVFPAMTLRLLRLFNLCYIATLRLVQYDFYPIPSIIYNIILLYCRFLWIFG